MEGSCGCGEETEWSILSQKKQHIIICDLFANILILILIVPKLIKYNMHYT